MIIIVAKYQTHHAGSNDVIAIRFQDDLWKTLGRMTTYDHTVACQIKSCPMQRAWSGNTGIAVKLIGQRSTLVGTEGVEGDHILIGTDATAGRFA